MLNRKFDQLCEGIWKYLKTVVCRFKNYEK